MPSFSYIAIIFNPNSTGNAKKQAKQLHAVLQKKLPGVTTKLMPTQHGGHAIELAYEIAKTHKSPLIISASGDGGYNEVVNGAMRAVEEGSDPICAVLPSGNANDHARTMQDKPLAERIIADAVTRLELLEVTMTDDSNKTTSRYAHSYVGLGLTPTIAVELNKHTLNSFRETWIVLRTFWRLRPVVLRTAGHTSKVDSLICSVIPEMAKVLTLSDKAHPDDGMFEITTLPHNKKFMLVFRLLKGIFSHMGGTSRVHDYSCTVLEATPIQLDGEVMDLAANTELTISIRPAAIRTIV
ncbi:MAG TPA: diacylglycerol kinase family protein [Candidatus Saccharimonadales bacterium]|jgi:diacylglycerol kinase family enzyme